MIFPSPINTCEEYTEWIFRNMFCATCVLVLYATEEHKTPGNIISGDLESRFKNIYIPKHLCTRLEKHKAPSS